MHLLVTTENFFADKELEALEPTNFLQISELVLQLIEQQKPQYPLAKNVVEIFLPIVYPKYDRLLSYPLIALMMANVSWNKLMFKLNNFYQLFDQTFGNQIPIIVLPNFHNLSVRNVIEIILAEVPPLARSKIVRSWHGKVSFKYPLLAELFTAKCLIQNLHFKPIAELLMKSIFVDRKNAIISCLIDEAMLEKVFCEDDYRAFDSVLCDNWDPSADEFSRCKALNKLLFVLLEDRRFEVLKFLFSILLKRSEIFMKMLFMQDQARTICVLDSCILRLPEDQKKCLAEFVIENLSMERLTEISAVNFTQAVFWTHHCSKEFGISFFDIERSLFPMVTASSHLVLKDSLEYLSSNQQCREIFWDQIGLTNDSGSNILHLSIESNTTAAVESITTFLATWNPPILRELLLEIDDNGENVLFKAVKNQDPKMPEAVLSLLNARSDFPVGQVRDMLCARDKAGHNLLLAALSSGNGGLTRRLLATLKSQLPVLAFQNLLFQSTEAGENLIYVAVKHCDYATIMAIQDFIKAELGDHDHVFDAMLHQETRANTNLLYLILTRSYQHQISRDPLFCKI
jgi:hypothetical protein